MQQPDLFNQVNKRQRKGVSSLIPENDKTSLNAAKLKNKLSRIENDILFDRDQAENMWQNKLAELRKDTAKFLRNAVAKEQQIEPPPAELKDTQIQDASDKLAESICSGSNENDDMLGGLFGADLEGPSAPSSSSGPNGSTIIRNRDFGNPTGMNPRRVLEEACRARFERYLFCAVFPG